MVHQLKIILIPFDAFFVLFAIDKGVCSFSVSMYGTEMQKYKLFFEKKSNSM